MEQIAFLLETNIQRRGNFFSNHSTTVPATPSRYDNHSTVALWLSHAKKQTVSQQFLHTCSLYMQRVLFGFTGGRHDWNLAFVLQG